MPPYAYLEGEFLPLAQAKISIMTHALHYGTAVFEGIRGNWNAEQNQLYLFRLREHYMRLAQGCGLLLIDLPYSVDDMCELTLKMVHMSGLREDVYVRPLAYKGSEALGVRLHHLEDKFLALVIPWGPYLNAEGGTCCVSTWRRPEDNTIPPQAKVTGAYINNALAKTEAVRNGYDEAILLTPDGHVGEGSGENIFLVKGGVLITPPIYNNILVGITRDTVIQLARRELGLEVMERPVDRCELYLAEECFLSGTAAHISPIVAIDQRPVGDGKVGKITRSLQDIYGEVIKGNIASYKDWLSPVY